MILNQVLQNWKLTRPMVENRGSQATGGMWEPSTQDNGEIWPDWVTGFAHVTRGR